MQLKKVDIKVLEILKAAQESGIECILANSNNSITIFFDEDTEAPNAGVHHIATILKGG